MSHLISVKENDNWIPRQPKQFSTTKGRDLAKIGDVNVSRRIPVESLFTAPNVSELPDKDALNSLLRFIEEQLQNKPPTSQNANGRNIRNFLEELSKAISKQAIELAQRRPDSDFQCEVYLKILAKLTSDGDGLPRTELSQVARRALIGNIDGDGVFRGYRSIDWGFHANYYQLQIMKNSERPEIRAWACLSLVNYDTYFNVVSACRPARASAELFEQKLKETETVWIAGAGELASVPRIGARLKQTVLKQVADVETILEEMHQEYDDERAARVLDLIENVRSTGNQGFWP